MATLTQKRTLADTQLRALGYPQLGYNPMVAAERGAMVIEAQRKFMKNMWGAPDNILAGINDVSYLQNTDLTSLYKDRIIPIPSNQVTAAMLNGQAGFLSSVVSPMFQTPEMNFQVKYREMNQLVYTRTAAGGIPNEQTYTETTWTDTVERVQLNAKIGMEVALDPNFGEDRWLFELAGLASNAMLTIHKSIAYALITIGYQNMVENQSRDIPFDLSKLLQAESSAFALAALDQSRFERLIRSYERRILGLNMLILPQGASSYISELTGESSSMIAQKMIQDPETERWEIEMIEGPRTVKTLVFGERRIQCVELPEFAVNMKDDRREQPLETLVTLGQFYPPDPDVHATDCNTHSRCDVLDPYLFFETKTQGDEVKVSWLQALRSAFYYDHKTGKVSDKAYKFADHMTNIVKKNPQKRPYDWIKPGADDINKELDYDNNEPDIDLIKKPTLLEMHGWRDQFVGVTYIPTLNEYRVPIRIGDFHLRALPNEWVLKCAEHIGTHIGGGTDGLSQFDSMINEFISLSHDIARTEWTNDYLRALIDTNLVKMRGTLTGNNRKLKFDPTPIERRNNFPSAALLDEWVPNEFGALDIPHREGRVKMSYPPGFDFGGGIMTLAKEATDDNSDWKEAGARAKRVVDYFKLLLTHVKEYIGHNDNIDESLTPPWIHADNAVANLMDSIRPHGIPVFLAVPNTLSSTELQNQQERGKVRRQDFLNILDDNVILRDNVDNTKTNINGLDTNVSYLISNIVRFMSCLTDTVYQEAYKQIGLFKNKTFSSQTRDLMSLILDICKYNNNTKDKVDDTTSFVASLITYEFLKKINEGKDDNDRILLLNNLLKDANKSTTRRTLIEKLKNEHGFITSSNINNFSRELIQLERNSKSIITNTISTYSYEELVDKVNEQQILENKINRTDKETTRLEQLEQELISADVDIRPPIPQPKGKISGNYSQQPEDFKRAPLMASNKLLEYLETANPILAIPADPASFYNAPIRVDLAIPASLKEMKKMQSLRNDQFGLSSLAFNLKFEGKGFSSSGKGLGVNLGDPFITKKSKSVNIENFLSSTTSFGAFGDEDDEISRRYRPNAPLHQRKVKVTDEDGEEEEIDEEVFDEFFGPWDNRMKFANNISSPVVRFLFRSILLSKNSMNIHEKLFKSGMKIINVMMFRLCIQHIVSSAIVMEAGSNTIMTPIGHAHVMVTKEERGIFNINCGFFHGIIRKNPYNIGLIPYCIPNTFIGGMKIDFMRDPSHWHYQNPEKESIIAILTPVSEYMYEAPIHMLNRPTYSRPDIDNAPHLRKWSGADYFEHVFGSHNVNAVDNWHNERKSYGRFVNTSLVAHRGVVGYIDSSTGKYKQVEGTGPRGDIRMNIHGAHEVFNGVAVRFPGKGDSKILNDKFY